MSVNKVIILGRLGQDPELKYTPGGAAVCNFSLATSENWTDKSGQKQERTEWHRIVVWGKLAELCNQYLSKEDKHLLKVNFKQEAGKIITDKKDTQLKLVRRRYSLLVVQMLRLAEQERKLLIQLNQQKAQMIIRLLQTLVLRQTTYRFSQIK